MPWQQTPVSWSADDRMGSALVALLQPLKFLTYLFIRIDLVMFLCFKGSKINNLKKKNSSPHPHQMVGALVAWQPWKLSVHWLLPMCLGGVAPGEGGPGRAKLRSGLGVRPSETFKASDETTPLVDSANVFACWSYWVGDSGEIGPGIKHDHSYLPLSHDLFQIFKYFPMMFDFRSWTDLSFLFIKTRTC